MTLGYEIREDGSVYSTSGDLGDPMAGVRLFMSFDRGHAHFAMRTETAALFAERAPGVGLLRYANPGQSAITNVETGEVLQEAVPPSGSLVRVPEIEVHEIGSFTIQPGTYDADNNELTPPVIDLRHHVNVWLAPGVVERLKWLPWAIAWSQNGQPAPANNAEVAVLLDGIELIDPRTIAAPVHGML